MRIVCATDFSEGAVPAAQASAAIVSRFPSAEAWLVHVLEPASTGLDPSGVQALATAARKQLEEEAARMREQTSAEVHTAVLSDLPSEALHRFAEEKEAFLLVLGSHGHARGPLLGVGTTSERVARFARVPVLVVRDAAPFETWAKGDRPLRILLGVDMTASSRPPIEWVKQLRHGGACDVLVGHVYHAVDASRRYGIRGRLSLVEPDLEIERLIARDLESAIGEISGSGKVSFRPTLGLGRLGDHLLELSEAEKVDLIVVGTHHKKGLERLTSISSIVLHYGHASVACVPAPVTPGLMVREIRKPERILVATDLSPFSNQAVGYAYGLLADGGGEVYLLHVLPPRQERREGEDTDVLAELRALVPPAAVASQIVTRTELVHSSDPARSICEVAERIGADAVCLASHGRSGLTRAALGSVAEEVLRQSHRPVLVVRPLPP
jgi:nucleotide-binding universal stress UspA family protein